VTGSDPARALRTLEERRWRVLVVTGTGAFMGPLDVTVVALALPAMGRALDLSFSSAIWVQAGYLLAYTLVLIPAGRLADQWGRLRVWRAGATTFALASLAAGLSTGSATLLTARVVQGAGGAMLAATATALVTAVFPPHQRGRALGLNVMALYLGLSTGPLVGGLIVEHASWRWIFLVNIPVAAAALLGSLGLREPRPHAGRPRLDPLGTLLLGGALAGLMIGLSFAPLWGWGSARAVGLMTAGALLLVAFVALELRARAPLLDLSLFRRSRVFAMGNVAALLNYLAMFATISLTAVLLEVVGGHSPVRSGLIMVIQPALMVALSPLAGRLSDRLGSRALASGGMVAVSIGLVVLATVPASVPSWQVMTGLGIVGVGMAFFSSPNTSAVMGSVDRPRLAVAAAVLASMRSLGQSLSLAVLGALAAAPLGAAGARVLFGGDAGASAADYLDGYRLAMAVAAGIALVGAAFSLARGPRALSLDPAAAPLGPPVGSRGPGALRPRER
jgi:EmrB/QacA subfamily drug resistance transporter